MRNVGSTDRVIRLGLAALIVALIAFEVVRGTPAIVAGVVAAVLALTGLVGMCPAYKLLGIHTCRRT